MAGFQFDGLDINDDGYFCGWDASSHNADSLHFKPQHMVKIIKPTTENIPRYYTKPKHLTSSGSDPPKCSKKSVKKSKKRSTKKPNRSKSTKHRIQTQKLLPLPTKKRIKSKTQKKSKPDDRKISNEGTHSQTIHAPLTLHKHKKFKTKRCKAKLAKISLTEWDQKEISPNTKTENENNEVSNSSTSRSKRQNESINTFLSRKRKTSSNHVGAVPFSNKDSLHSANCTPRDLVPTIYKICSKLPRVKNIKVLNRNSYSEPNPRRYRSKHAKNALVSHLERQENIKMHKEINKIVAQRTYHLDHLKVIFESLDKYIRKLDGAKIAKSGKQIETILVRFDKNIVYHLRDLRKVTWNLVFFLKSIQTRSRSNLKKVNNAHHHLMDTENEASFGSYHNVIAALLEDGDFVVKYVHVMAYLHLPNTACNPFLIPKNVLDPFNRCASSKKLKHAMENLKAVHLQHDLNRMYKLNEMDRHRYLSAHQWLLQLYQTSIVTVDSNAIRFNTKLKFTKTKDSRCKIKFPRLK